MPNLNSQPSKQPVVAGAARTPLTFTPPKDGTEAYRGAARTLANLDFSAADEAARQHKALIAKALATRKAADLDDIEVNAQLAADAEVRELMRRTDIDPLKLSEQVDAIYKKHEASSISAAGKMGPVERDEMRSRWTMYRGEKLPGIRQQGYKRESAQQLAAHEWRKQMWTIELNDPATSKTRRVELNEKIVADIENLAGVHITEEDAAKRIGEAYYGFKRGEFFEEFDKHPVRALRNLAGYGFAAEEEADLRREGENILEERENDRIRRQKRGKEEADMRSEAVLDKLQDEIVHHGASPDALFAASPELLDRLNPADKASVYAFHSTYTRALKTPEASQEDFAGVLADMESGEYGPRELVGYFKQKAAEGVLLGDGQMTHAFANGTNAFKARVATQNTMFDSSVKLAEGNINRFTEYVGGIRSILSEEYQSQLRLTTSSALTMLRKRVNQARKEAAEQIRAGLDVDVNDLLDPTEVADEVLFRHLAPIVKALKSQKFDSPAFNGVINPELAGSTDEKAVLKGSLKALEKGELTGSDLLALHNARELIKEFERLKATRSQQPSPQETGSQGGSARRSPVTNPMLRNLGVR